MRLESGTMSANLSTTSVALPPNSTDGPDSETRAAIHEFRVFNMVILSLAVGIVTVTAVVCCVSHCSHWRRHKRARGSTVGQASGAELGDAKVTGKSSWNPFALLWRQEPTGDSSHIYYIYCNPLPVGHPEDETPAPQAPATHSPLTLVDYASDPKSGIVLDPPTFYMQL